MCARTVRVVRTLVVLSFALLVLSKVSAGQSVAANLSVTPGEPEPYTADFTITNVKTLADGTAIQRQFAKVQAWDGHGRTMTAITPIPASGEETVTTKVSVSDPMARTSFSWDSETRLATVIKRPVPALGPSSCLSAAGQSVPTGSTADSPPRGKVAQLVDAPAGLTASVSSVQGPIRLRPTTTIEHLGTRIIQGFETYGSRVTQTTSVGATANSEALVSTRESWQASVHGIGLTVREVDDDPRNGKTIVELVKFSLGEPDPASFQPPEGYAISTLEMNGAHCMQLPPTPSSPKLR